MRFNVLHPNHADDVTTQLCGHSVGLSEATIRNIPISSVWFFFTGTIGRNGLVTIPGFHRECFCLNRWYARTKGGVVLVKNHLVRLAPHQFVRVHQSILVNLTGWRELDLEDKGFLFSEPGQPREWVPIGRRRYSEVRRALGLSTRRVSNSNDVTGS